MLPIRDNIVIANSRTFTSINPWVFLNVEFLVGGAISGIFALLGAIKSFLPKPPRDLTGNVVLIAGASSTLGQALAEEFAQSGCSIILVDNDLRSVKKIAARLRSRYRGVEEIGPDHRKRERPNAGSTMTAYQCDLLNHKAIFRFAKSVEDKIGGIDVLVTCIGLPDQDIFDTVSRTLMGHYWMMLAFLPFILQRDRAHVVGIMPVTSGQDAYLSSRAVVAGLMESLGQELSNFDTCLTFLSMSPTIQEHGSTRQCEQQTAKEVVQAVKMDQSSIYFSERSEILYRISCMIYRAITTVTQWVHTQGCDYSF